MSIALMLELERVVSGNLAPCGTQGSMRLRHPQRHHALIMIAFGYTASLCFFILGNH